MTRGFEELPKALREEISESQEDQSSNYVQLLVEGAFEACHVEIVAHEEHSAGAQNDFQEGIEEVLFCHGAVQTTLGTGRRVSRGLSADK